MTLHTQVSCEEFATVQDVARKFRTVGFVALYFESSTSISSLCPLSLWIKCVTSVHLIHSPPEAADFNCVSECIYARICQHEA